MARPAPLRRRLGIALGRGLTLATMSDRLGAVYGNRIAFSLPTPSVVCGTRTITFDLMARKVARLSGALTACGLSPGESVIVIPSNGCDFVLSMLAVVRAGGIAVPLNPLLKPAEVRALAVASGARTIIVDVQTMRSSAGGRRQIPSIKRWISLGPVRGATDALSLARRIRTAPPAAEVSPGAVVSVMYTSGTTGKPKGAKLTSEGLLSVLSKAAWYPAGWPGTVKTAVTALPVAHVMGCAVTLGLAMSGIRNIMLPHFDADGVLHVISKERAEMFAGVPAMYRALLDAGAASADLRSVRAWISAADAMPRDLIRTFRSFGRFAGPLPAAFLEFYGMVELAGAALIAVTPPGPDVRIGGLAVPGYHVKVIDKKGKEVPRGKVGELCVRGPGVPAGDAGSKNGTATDSEWFRTGDLARIGRFGAVTLEGRAKDVIKVGGYSVYPVEVEEEIRRHPSVADVAVLGVPDRAKGTVPAAVVVAARGSKLTASQLEQWARKEIASYRRPRRWLVLKSLPRTATRKADKRALAKLF